MKPIGTMKSLFHFKNGTPRQANLCHSAPGILTIEKSVFNNPEHSLEGLEEYSHAWVIFVFHKNNNAYTKAKVKPPRLDGRRVGVFSSRSPYRPNNIGLSLLKIDKIEGATIYFSGVDMIDGTEVLDIKPYIPEYDCPPSNTKQPETEKSEPAESENINQNNSEIASSDMGELEKGFYSLSEALTQASESLTSNSLKCQYKNCEKQNKLQSTESPVENRLVEGAMGGTDEDLDAYLGGILSQAVHSLSLELPSGQDIASASQTDFGSSAMYANPVGSKNSDIGSHTGFPSENGSETKLEKLRNSVGLRERTLDTNKSSVNSPVVAPWLLNPPVQKLNVTFTADALQQLQQFSKSTSDPNYRLRLLSGPEETKNTIGDVLREEPRSVYRRNHCQDSLYFFTVDVVHVTCWFDEGTAQVLRLKPIAMVERLRGKFGVVVEEKGEGRR